MTIVLRRPVDYLYLTRARAVQMGFTHEGTLFGVPAWLHPEGELVAGCPKIPALQLYTLLIDGLFEVATLFMPAGQAIVSPIHVRARITPERTP